MLAKLIVILMLAFGLVPQIVQATPCGGEYEVQSGDSLSDLAGFGPQNDNESYWTILFKANQDRIGSDPNLLYAGVKLRIPCLDENGDILPGQFDDDGYPVAGAFDRELDLTMLHAAVKSPETKNPITDLEVGDSSDAENTIAETTSITQTQPTTFKAVMAKAITSTVVDNNSMNLLTGDDNGVWADPNINNDGVVAKLIDAALNENARVSHKTTWINDWSVHLDPLLTAHSFDVGFPWLKPDCSVNVDDARCSDFLFSESIYQISILLFTNADLPMTYNNDTDVKGKIICRPSGYFTHDLDANGRNWLVENKIQLKRPGSVQLCFRLLLQNQVDAVAVNEYTGRAAIKSMKIADKVSIIDSKPLSTENLYALVHNQHPHAEELIMQINQSIKASQASGTYQQILDSN